MSEDNKKFPNSTEGIAGLLNITPHGDTGPRKDSTPVESSSLFAENTVAAPSNLPIADLEEPMVDQEPVAKEPIVDAVKNSRETPKEAPKETLEEVLKVDPATLPFAQEQPQWTVGKIIKMIAPYLAIFAIAIGLYFFYFNDFSINSLFNSDTLKIESITDSETNKEYEQLKKDAASDYKSWLNQFFTDVNDDSISSMDADVSGNGLTNFEKYLLNLNPKVYSTRGNIGDGQSVLDGINPWTGKTFTDKQKQLVEKYINPELISNRITAAAITRGVTKYAQYVSSDSPYYIDPVTLQQVGSNGQAVVTPTQIATSTSTPASTTTPANILTNQNPSSSSSSTAPNLRPDESIDQSKPGLLEIPANKISVPLVWTQDIKDFEKDLKNGVVHYPGTALPGELGTSYISGHSSGYLWDKSPYKQIFAILGSVKDGTSFTITATQKNGKTVKFNYIVERRGEFAANDQAQFISTSDSVVALSTCWPVGTTARRLVLFAKLTQIERS